MQGNKTHEQQVKILERKDESRRPADAKPAEPEAGNEARATHRESRNHNKHNDPGQSGHRRQEHGPAEERR